MRLGVEGRKMYEYIPRLRELELGDGWMQVTCSLKVGEEVAERDIVQFVPFRQFAQVSG